MNSRGTERPTAILTRSTWKRWTCSLKRLEKKGLLRMSRIAILTLYYSPIVV